MKTEMTTKEALEFKIPFGKYKNEFISEVLMADRNYLEWLYDQLDFEKDKLAIAINLVLTRSLRD